MDQRIQRSLELLQQTPPVQIAVMAVKLNLSTSRLRHLFKKEFGISPGSFLKLVRLRRAEQLLLNSFLSVKEIACLVGLSDVSHFVRNYKAAYGKTPSETRIIHRV